MIDDLLVCPVCHSELPIAELRIAKQITCQTCRYQFRFTKGVFDFLPHPFPDENISRTADLWEKLQENGIISYTQDPANNLSIGERKDARLFGEFCELSGTVLDIGCGPQVFPTYAQGFNGRFVGIDPLLGEQRRFDFALAVGEYLPFRDHSFDQVIFATSLDHVLDAEKVFLEVRRVLKPSGSISIWFGTPESQSIVSGFVRKFAKLGIYILTGQYQKIAQRIRQKTQGASSQFINPITNNLIIPEGAADQYHVTHLDNDIISKWVIDAGFKITKSDYHPELYSRFLKAVLS